MRRPFRQNRIKESNWKRGMMAAIASLMLELASADFESLLSESNKSYSWSNNSLKDAQTTEQSSFEN